jgi:hypothetical protein
MRLPYPGDEATTHALTVPLVTVVLIRNRKAAKAPVTDAYFCDVFAAHAIGLPTAPHVPV